MDSPADEPVSRTRITAEALFRAGIAPQRAAGRVRQHHGLVAPRQDPQLLARGGEVHPAKMVRDFLGREPNSEAFFAEITGKR